MVNAFSQYKGTNLMQLPYNSYTLLSNQDTLYLTLLNADGTVKDELIDMKETISKHPVFYKKATHETTVGNYKYTKFKSCFDEPTTYLEPVNHTISIKQFIKNHVGKNKTFKKSDLYGATYKDNFVFNNYMQDNYQETNVSNLLIASIDIETNVFPDFDDFAPKNISENIFPSYEKSLYEINLLTTSYMQSNSNKVDVHVFLNRTLCTQSDKEIHDYITDNLKGQTTLIVNSVNINSSENELGMLISFFTNLQQTRPAIITGWNIDNFDIPYIHSRLLKYMSVEQALNYWNFSKYKTNFDLINVYERENNYYGETHIELKMNNNTVNIIDYMQLYKKYELDPRPSYSLDSISKIEINATKLKYTGSFRDFYQKSYDREFTLYNIIDTLRVLEIDKAKSLINILYSLTYIVNANVKDSFFNTRLWDMLITNKAYKRNQIPVLANDSEHYDTTYQGAFVKDVIRPNQFISATEKGKPFVFASFDATSLYPSTAIQHNISPETKRTDKSYYKRLTREQDLLDITEYPSDLMASVQQHAKNINATMTANGVFYDKTGQGVVPEIMNELMERRKATKNLMKTTQKKLIELKHLQNN